MYDNVRTNHFNNVMQETYILKKKIDNGLRILEFLLLTSFLMRNIFNANYINTS